MAGKQILPGSSGNNRRASGGPAAGVKNPAARPKKGDVKRGAMSAKANPRPSDAPSPKGGF